MSYFLNFVRVWAYTIFVSLPPMAPPYVGCDTPGRTSVTPWVNNLAQDPWTSIQAGLREDSHSPFTSLGYHTWAPGWIVGAWPLNYLRPGTTYEFRVRAYDARNWRYSDWAYLTFTTAQ